MICSMSPSWWNSANASRVLGTESIDCHLTAARLNARSPRSTRHVSPPHIGTDLPPYVAALLVLRSAASSRLTLTTRAAPRFFSYDHHCTMRVR